MFSEDCFSLQEVSRKLSSDLTATEWMGTSSVALM